MKPSLPRADVVRLVAMVLGPGMPFVVMSTGYLLHCMIRDSGLPPVMRVALDHSLLVAGPVLGLVAGMRLLVWSWDRVWIRLAVFLFLPANALILLLLSHMLLRY